MNVFLVVLRTIHVLSGVLWVGFGVFMGFILGPTLDRMGPDGGKVMAAIGPRLHTAIMPLLALLTMLSGATILWIVSGGFSSAYVHSRLGLTFEIGGIAAIATFIIGLTVIRPAMTRAMMLGATIGTAPPERQGAIAAEAKQFRDRALLGGRIGTGLLVFATICMAIARYL